MGASNSAGKNAQFYKLKEFTPEGASAKKVAVIRQEKIDGAWKETEEFTRISGFLKGITIREYEYKGEKKESIEFNFIDDETGDAMTVSAGLSMTTCSILNGLAGISKFGVIAFECGMNKEKTFPTVYLKNDNEKTEWKHKVYPKGEAVKDKSGKSIGYDSFDRDQFFKKVITEDIMPKLKDQKIPEIASSSKAAPSAGNIPDNPAPATTRNESDFADSMAAPMEDGDLPF